MANIELSTSHGEYNSELFSGSHHHLTTLQNQTRLLCVLRTHNTMLEEKKRKTT
jgi:hypothetical protein